MFLVLSAGSGGGWAVNSFFPKENGIISQDSASLISIYGHELAHTLAGPVNEKGQAAGDVPFWKSGRSTCRLVSGKSRGTFTMRNSGNMRIKSAEISSVLQNLIN